MSTDTFTPPAPSQRTQSVGRVRRWAERIGPTGLALFLALTAVALGLRGTDVAAQAYRVDVLRLHGFVLWDNGWYGGSLPLGYSVLFPVLGAVLGLAGASVVSAVAATWCFDRVVQRMAGRRTVGSWYFAASTLLAVSIGQLPYLAGEAAALGAVLALVSGRHRLGVALGLLSALFSPLAAAFLILALVVWALHRGVHRRSMLLTAGTTGVVVVAIAVLFPGDGPFPFPWTGLVVVELLCLLVVSPVVRTTRVIRFAAVVYGSATLCSFLVPNPLGGNATRLAESVGVPLVACLMDRPHRPTRMPTALVAAARYPFTSGLLAAARHPFTRGPLLARPALAFGILLPFAVWQWAPGTGVTARATTPSNTVAFYQPLLHELATVDKGRPIRLEIVPTRDHWESADVGPYVSLARGWERQLDVADNPIFYVPGKLNARSYHAWLDAAGVSYVALPAAPLDYAGVAEAALLRSDHVSDLRPVWSTADWRLWRVAGSPGLVSGPARLTTLAPDRLDLDVARSGNLIVRVRYTSYWHLIRGDACVQATPAGWTQVRVTRAGPVELDAELVGSDPAACPTP